MNQETLVHESARLWKTQNHHYTNNLWDTAELRNDSRSKAHMFLFISSVIQLLRVVA